jgi:hypothetical protein
MRSPRRRSPDDRGATDRGPVRRRARFKPIPLSADDVETTIHLARFIEVLDLDETDIHR